ncbi:MAG: DUF4349 domain-containing protein [archaeon]
MSIKQQLAKIKDNWVLLAAILIVLLLLNSGGVQNLTYSMKSSFGGGTSAYDSGYVMAESVRAPYPAYDDFAPEEEERKIVKTANLETEVERGEFQESEAKLKSVIEISDAYLLDENVYRRGEGWKEYYTGTYQIKVDSTKYDSILSQLKDIGEVQSFSERADDVTGSYANLELNLQLEKDKLERYRELYDEAKTVEEKLNLNDRIFYQERTVKYLEDALKNMDQRIDYSTIYFTLEEERTDFVNIDFVDFSTLLKNIVDSTSALLSFLFTIVPWAVAFFAIRFVWKFVKKRK